MISPDAPATERAATADALQRAVATWHEQRFPASDPVLVGLKAAAELGELAEAIHSRAPDSPGVRGEVGAEAADVAICLFTICERWFGVDLLEEVEKKLAVLTDPNSGHRSALQDAGRG